MVLTNQLIYSVSVKIMRKIFQIMCASQKVRTLSYWCLFGGFCGSRQAVMSQSSGSRQAVDKNLFSLVELKNKEKNSMYSSVCTNRSALPNKCWGINKNKVKWRLCNRGIWNFFLKFNKRARTSIRYTRARTSDYRWTK